MAIGEKSIETRPWSTPYRGLVAIHAAKNLGSIDLVDEEPFSSALIRRGYPTYKRYGEQFVKKHALEFGAIVAVGELADCVQIGRADQSRIEDSSPDEYAFGNYEIGRFGWVFRNVRRLATPIPYRGQQGLWTLEPAIVDQINQEVSAHV